MDVLLNEDKLEVHLLPVNIAAEMILEKAVVLEDMNEKDSLQQFIKISSLETTNDTDSINCNSLALVESFLNPDMAPQKQLITPPENTQRKIYVYTRIDAERMKRDFWKSLKEHGK